VKNPTRREASLADRFIAKTYKADERYIGTMTMDALKRKTRSAAKFIFDEAATRRVANVVRDIPELLVRESAFARAPFELTWLEFPHWVYWDALGNPRGHRSDTADHTVGYLIDHGTVTVVTGGTISQPHLGPSVGILQYQLNTEWPQEAMDAFAAIGGTGVTLDRIDQCLWGSTYHRLDLETRDRLRHRNVVSVIPGLLHTRDADKHRATLHRTFALGAGELRNIIAMLLIMNRPKIARMTGVPGGHGIYRGKSMTYNKHTSVTIDLDPIPELRSTATPAGAGALRRRHPVRGHYCHNADAREYHRIAGCIHDWIVADEEWHPMPDVEISDSNHWLCGTCGGKRWWKSDHERGDETLGIITHDDYNIVG
jgi:hypothetical protein